MSTQHKTVQGAGWPWEDGTSNSHIKNQTILLMRALRYFGRMLPLLWLYHLWWFRRSILHCVISYMHLLYFHVPPELCFCLTYLWGGIWEYHIFTNSFLKRRNFLTCSSWISIQPWNRGIILQPFWMKCVCFGPVGPATTSCCNYQGDRFSILHLNKFRNKGSVQTEWNTQMEIQPHASYCMLH